MNDTRSNGSPGKLPRRRILQWTAAAATAVGAAWRRGADGAEPAPQGAVPPTDPGNEQPDATACQRAGAHQDLIDKAYQLGHQYEKEHGGCSQCTVAALQDALPFLTADVGVFRAASCLDGGATPTKIQNCGSFTGAGMAIGYLCGRTRNGRFEGNTKRSHELIRKLYRRYEEAYGSVLCKDVREKAERDCPKVVGLAARWTAEILVEEFLPQQPDAKADNGQEDEADP